MLENLHKIGLTSIEKAPVTQPNIYSLGKNTIEIRAKHILRIMIVSCLTETMLTDEVWIFPRLYILGWVTGAFSMEIRLILWRFSNIDCP